ncbi:MAG: NADP-dependent oxidoreductase [Parvularculales bacterium]
MSQTVNRRILLAAKPSDKLEPQHFSIEDAPIDEPGAGEILIKILYLSLDAANRAWMQGRTYRDEVGAGVVMPGNALGEVVTSNDASFAPGDLVEGDLGWQSYAVHPAQDLQKRTTHEPLSHLLGILGITGKTAYFGLLDVGRPKPGDVVVVSAAAGAVGSVAGQIAKHMGCQVIGITGSAKKCNWITQTLGFDGAINYREQKVGKALREACPQGIDVYFDNTGGDILEAALFSMKQGGRIVCCGAVSQYDTGNPGPGPRGVPGLIVTKRLTMEGFVVMDFAPRWAEAELRLAQWAEAGYIHVAEDILEGLEQAPTGLIGLLAGENTGKRLVKVA